MSISVCVITKDESTKLKRCMESLKGYGFEIVVVDTGSKDDTDKVIEQYADKIGKFQWCDDFSKARNYSISLASNDIILVLDSDEWIESCDIKAVEELINKNPKIVGRIERINDIASTQTHEIGHERISRIFDRRYYEYKGRIHEQVSSKQLGELIYEDVTVVIGHSGYNGTDEDKRRKAGRNIKLLLLDLQEHGDDPYILYQLGKGYYMQKEYALAAKYFEQGFAFDLEPKLEYVQDMVETYGYTLLNLKRYKEMLFLKEIYHEFALSADYVFLTGLAYMYNEMYNKAISEFEKATNYKISKIEGCNSFKAFYNAGVICECLGKRDQAREYYKKCGNYEPAMKGLSRLK